MAAGLKLSQSIMDLGHPGSAAGALGSGDGRMGEEWLHAQTWGRLWALLLSSATDTSYKPRQAAGPLHATLLMSVKGEFFCEDSMS